MSNLSGLAINGSVLSAELIKDGRKTVVALPNYYGNGEFWWFRTSSHHRPTTWDRSAGLSIQPQTFEQILSYGRQRIMAMVNVNVNPRLRLMSYFDEVNLLVSEPGQLIWDSQSDADNIEKLADAVSAGSALRISFSEDGDYWYSSKLDSANIDVGNQQFCLQNEISHWPLLPVQPESQQNKNIGDIYAHLTENNTLQAEHPTARQNMAEFKMEYVDMWRAIFEQGTMITAYSAKEGKAFKYKQLKVFIEQPGLVDKVSI